MKKKIICITTLLVLLLSINVFADEQTVQNVADTTNYQNTEIVNFEVQAKVIEVGEVKQIETGSIIDTVQEVKIKILEGSHKGEEHTTNYILSYDIEGKILAYELEEGDKVWIQLTENTDGTIGIAVENVVRQNYIIIMVLVFFASIILIGRKKGIQAILGLVVTILAVYFILVKSIYAGKSPILMSVITSAIIIISTLIIIGGVNKKVLTAAIGTFGGVLVAGIFSAIFGYLTKMSGACEDAVQLSINASSINFNFRELLFAGIIISALGACMDVGMSISSSLDEIKAKTPDISGKELFKRGMNITKDVI